MLASSPSSSTAAPASLDPVRIEAAFAITCERVGSTEGLAAPCAEILAALVEETGASRASLLLLNPDTGRLNMAAAIGLPPEIVGRDMMPRPRSISEWVFRNRRGLVLNGEVRDERFEGTSSHAVTESSMCVPIETAAGPLGVLSLARHSPARPFSDPDILTLSHALPPVIDVIRRAWRMERAERSLQRLEVADGAPDRTLVPRGAFAMRSYDVGLARRPSWNLGGDFCDRVPHANGGNTVLVADVSGDGAFAALSAGFAQGLFVGAASPERSAAGIVAQLNAGLHSRIGDRQFVALWLAQLAKNGEVSYCNAGYPAPFWVPADGTPTIRLDRGGPVAGAFPHAQYQEEHVRLLPGDLLVAVSDGLLAERGPTDQPYGADRVAELLQEMRREPLDRLTHELCEAVRAYSARVTPTDDILVLAIRYRPGD